MKSLTKRYVLLWFMVLLIFNVVVLMVQYLIPSLDIYRGAAVETVKHLISSSSNISSYERDAATKGLLYFQSTVYGVFIFNVLMVIQLILFIISSLKIKSKDDMLTTLPLLMLGRKFLILTVVMCLAFSLISNIPTFVAIIITLILIIYMFIQYNNYGLQKEYVDDLEKRNKERRKQ